MKSKIKIGTYVLPTLLIAFLLFVFVGMSIDGSIAFYSLAWNIFALIIILLFVSFWYSFKKIPKIQIIANVIHYNKNGTNSNFRIADITNIVKVKSNINQWYSFRGGLKIYTISNMYIFPYNVYSNEVKLLQYIYQTNDTVIVNNCSFSIENIKFIKYLYRNSYGLLLILIVPLIILIININNQNISLLNTIIYTLILGLLLTPVLISSRYLKIEGRYLCYINPLLMKICKYDLSNIEYANSRAIYTGNSRLKNLTIELVDKRILTLNASLNKQKEIDEIANILNTKSKNR